VTHDRLLRPMKSPFAGADHPPICTATPCGIEILRRSSLDV